MVSLLLNCSSLTEVREIFHDVVVALQSKTITDRNKAYIDRLVNKVNTFDTSTSSNADSIEYESVTEQTNLSASSRFTEEDCLNLVTFSPFKTRGFDIFNTASCTVVENASGIKNPYHSEVLLQQSLNRYIPILPLWGRLSILLKTIQRFQSVLQREPYKTDFVLHV